MARRMTLLHLQTQGDEALWRTALASHNVPTAAIPRDGPGIVERIQSDARLMGAGALVVDEQLLAQQGLTALRLARRIRRVHPELAVFVRLAHRARIESSECAWATQAGLAGLLPGTSAARWRETLAPPLAKVLDRLGRGPMQVERLGEFLRVLNVDSTGSSSADAVGQAFEAFERVAGAGLDFEGVAAAMRAADGVGVKDRAFRGRTYRQCFVAQEAVQWLVKRQRLPRKTAIALGRGLQALGAIHHVVRERDFDDALLFFRFAALDGPVAAIDLCQLATAMRGPTGVDIDDRSYLGKPYPQCFTGTGTVDWLVRRHGLTVGEAEFIGQRLIDLGVIRHVVGEHGFSDAGYFYRFVEDEARG